jgi:hypothetical protein
MLSAQLNKQEHSVRGVFCVKESTEETRDKERDQDRKKQAPVVLGIVI